MFPFKDTYLHSTQPINNSPKASANTTPKGLDIIRGPAAGKKI